MATKGKSDLAWTEINPDSLSLLLATKYQAYKAAYAAMKEARQGFEEAMNDAAGLPEGKRVVCGYNFGKLSVAVADDDRKPAKVQVKGTLADFLASQADAGRRA